MSNQQKHDKENKPAAKVILLTILAGIILFTSSCGRLMHPGSDEDMGWTEQEKQEQIERQREYNNKKIEEEREGGGEGC